MQRHWISQFSVNITAPRSSADEHHLIVVTQSQRETVMQPDRVPDDLDRIPVERNPTQKASGRDGCGCFSMRGCDGEGGAIDTSVILAGGIGSRLCWS
jgi:hypothetical protein